MDRLYVPLTIPSAILSIRVISEFNAQRCLPASSSMIYLDKSGWHPQMPHPRCLSLALTSSGPLHLVAIDPLFPFQPWSVIVSHLVISHFPDIFHSFLAHPIPFHREMRQTRQHVLNHGPCRPANHACGKLWDLRCRQRVFCSEPQSPYPFFLPEQPVYYLYVSS